MQEKKNLGFDGIGTRSEFEPSQHFRLLFGNHFNCNLSEKIGSSTLLSGTLCGENFYDFGETVFCEVIFLRSQNKAGKYKRREWKFAIQAFQIHFSFQNVVTFDDWTKDIRRSLTNLADSDEDDSENLCKLKTTLRNRR